jgi:hypothetical protein
MACFAVVSLRLLCCFFFSSYYLWGYGPVNAVRPLLPTRLSVAPPRMPSRAYTSARGHRKQRGVGGGEAVV